MRSKATGLYVSADDGGSRPLVTNGPRIDLWERFQVFHNTDGTVSFKAVNGKFVSGGGGPLPLIAEGPAIGLWEKFEYVAPAPVVVLKAQVNNKYVSATNGGHSPLVTAGPAPNAWEKLELVDAGAGTIALKALVNN
ncbi:fascin domain-containing protein [Plantactinospora sp. CA-294935]|uniref:fascin domain-containing protein n=1 Tax=Plantactinospora sp. CA-294935 TaxID=3240012 RepID=UPI003D8B82C2